MTGTPYLFYKCYIKVHIIFPCGIKPTNSIFKSKPERRQTSNQGCFIRDIGITLSWFSLSSEGIVQV